MMVDNCTGVRSNESGSVRTFATCMPLMMLMALMILYGRCVLFSESSDLPQVSEVVLADSNAQGWTFDEDDDEGSDITVNHSGWSRPFSADHAELAWSEQIQRDAARARHNRKYVRRSLSSRSDKWTHRRIAAHVEDCLGGLVLGGGDEDGGDLFTLHGRMQMLERRRDFDSESADFVGSVSGGEDEDGSDLLSVKGEMLRSDDDGAGCSVSRGSVSGLLLEEEAMQESCLVEDDDWEFWGVAKYRHDDSKCHIRYDRCSWPRCDEEDTVRVEEEETVKDAERADGLLCWRLGGKKDSFKITKCGQAEANRFSPSTSIRSPLFPFFKADLNIFTGDPRFPPP
jgi:hypothetical protein